MISFWIYFWIYSLGCFFMMVNFLIGRTPALNERPWPWPVIFLWPLLVLWPIHALAGRFIKRAPRREK
jgi:hypothetical protein